MRALAIVAATMLATGAAAAPREKIVKVEHRAAEDLPSIGPADAPVTVELYFIPGAVQSKGPYHALVDLQARHPRRIRLVLRPLSRQGMILVPEAVMEAHAQGKFFELLDAITAAGRSLSKQDILDLAAQVGVDPERVSSAWDDERHKDELDANDARRLRHYSLSVPDALFDGKPVPRPLASLSDTDLENAYDDAYDRAQALLDAGVPRRALAAAFDRDLARPTTLFVPGPVDDDAAGDPTPDLPPLAGGPLALAGLPSSGPADAAVPVVVLCDLTQRSCLRQLDTATKVAALFPHDVRVIWSPWYAADAPDSGNLGLADAVSRAALCAEEQGAGWDWLAKALERTQRQGARWGPADDAIRAISDDAGADGKAISTCLEQRPPDLARRRIEADARRGVRHGPALVVGGRIYTGGVSDARILQGLIEDELEPGLLGRAAPDWQTD
jgi:predicted DsbA family dithiol-disulfide isomerase